MTEKLKQSLSAVIDDEADAFELRRVLDELDRDDELRALWDRYHIIGAALRRERLGAPVTVRDGVKAALEELDDAAGAEELRLAEAPAVADAEIDAAAPPSRYSRLGRFTGLAVAASVAFAVVLGFNGFDLTDRSAAPIASTDPAPGAASGPGAAAGPGVVRGQNATLAFPGAGRLASEVSPSDVQRAQAYMLHHTQQQALNQAGVMSFVKMATYEAP